MNTKTLKNSEFIKLKFLKKKKKKKKKKVSQPTSCPSELRMGINNHALMYA
jgi:hypothetical protein